MDSRFRGNDSVLGDLHNLNSRGHYVGLLGSFVRNKKKMERGFVYIICVNSGNDTNTFSFQDFKF